MPKVACTYHDLTREYELSGETDEHGMDLYEPGLIGRQQGWSMSEGGEQDASNDKTVGFRIEIKGESDEVLYKDDFEGLNIDIELKRLSLIYGFSNPTNTFDEPQIKNVAKELR